MASCNSSPSSSSSSVPTGRWTYEVFLSFRGEDTRNTFVDHLYAALVQRGVYTFKDDEMVRRGKPISPELLKAIEESRSAVVVFSENYVNSSWCLDELAKIMECQNRMGQRVLPVFYHVDPSDVRGQKGNFATAFQHHEQKFRGEPDKLKKWREALTAASSISGWHVKSDNGGESDFINKIVRDILGNIKSHGMENNLIGIESHMDALTSLLDMEAPKEVRMVGIWGMGGIGKTTIAQAVFRRISYKFEGSSFVKDVRENSSNKNDICVLQEKILRDILMMHIFMIEDPDHGRELIQRTFSNKKVLLVLDDVDDIKQIEYLAATHEWFGPGSRIIITTRNEHLLSDAHAKYKPDLLLMDQAVELFSRYAFQKSSPPEGYKELSYRAIHYTGYLPLALKVLGSFFHGRQASVWESALNRLAKTPNIEIFKTLKLSFDGLEVSEKNIFLDIACFFKGKDKEHVTRILDSFDFDPLIGISVLIEKSLITVSKKRLDMHDLIQEMGWQIVRESFSNSRIWQFEEMHDLIMRNKKLKAIEAIVLRDKEYNFDDHDEKLGFSTKVFRSMKNLRLLDIDSKFRSHEHNFLPDELRWLCWHECPFSSLPEARLLKLVGLEMVNSTIQHLWEGQKECAAVCHRLSIAIPGSKIPSWFKEQQRGCNVALKLPPKWHTQVIGFAICGVFHGNWEYDYPRIIFKIVNDEKIIPKSEVDIIVPAAADNGNLWVCYIPFGFFQHMYHDFQPQDWSHIEGNLVMTLTTTSCNKSVRCGAHVVYKEDVESIHQLKTCIPDYGNLVQVDGDKFHEERGYEEKVSGNTYVYEEKSDDNNSKLMPLRSKTSQRHNIYNRYVTMTTLLEVEI